MVPKSKLEAALSVDTSKLPSAILDWANRPLEKIALMGKVAKKVSSGKKDPSEFKWSQQEIADASNQASAQSQLVATMLKSLHLQK